MITFEEFEQQWLEEILAGNPSTTQLGNRFAEKILRDWLDIDSNSAEVILCDGAGDGGIDAAVFIKEDLAEGIEGDSWILIQSKYGSSYCGANTIFSEGQKILATLEGRRDRLSSLSSELVERLHNFLENCGPKDRLEYVIATSKRLTPEEHEYLENIKTLGESKFKNCFYTDSVSLESIFQKVTEEETAASDKLSLSLTTTITNSGEILLIGSTKLRDIFRFLHDYKISSGDLDLLYEKNVRKFLGNKRKVNRGIEKTIENHPERFGLYNNGITFVAEKVMQKDNNNFTLTNPFIVNGCQTTRSIWSVLQRKLNSGGSTPSDSQQEWLTRLDQAVVVTKIVVVGTEGEELLTETTRYTNSQNAVSEKDFIALEKDFRNWAPNFNSKYGVFLEIQRGAWEARKAYQKQNSQVNPHYTESANAFELLKAYAAGWLSEPGIAYGKNPPFAPNGTLFNKIINEEGFGVDSLYASYIMQKLANGYGFGRGAKFPSRGQTRYLFIMVAVDLIKDLLINNRLDYSHTFITKAVINLEKSDLLKEVGEFAVQMIDDYLTDGNEDCLFNEPEFQKIRDLNAFLKSDKLGKGEEFSPMLRTQIAMTKKMFRKSAPIDNMKKALTVES